MASYRSRSFGWSPGGQEVIVRAGNYEICKAAFDKALFVYPTQHIELGQGVRVICKSKEDRTSAR